MERTLVLIKPDGVKRQLSGEIINRFERAGLKIKALKMVMPSRELANKHLPSDEKWIVGLGNKTLKNYKEKSIDPIKAVGTDNPLKIGQMVRKWLLEYLIEGPVVAMVLEGYHAVENARRLCGYTIPYSADVGSIRGDYALDSPAYANAEKRAVKNLVHAAEDAVYAKKEITLWFKKEEIMK